MSNSNQKQISSKDGLKIYTKLEEIYSKESINSTIESEYEDFRSKFNYLYKTDPTTIIKVPYTAILFGDPITHLFSNKIVANLSSELIIFFNKNPNNELNLKYFENAQEIKTKINEINNLNLTSETFSLNDFAILGYISALKYIKSNNNNYGSNVLIILNNPNKEDVDCYLSIFLAMFLCSLYINDIDSIINNSLNKSSLYEMVNLTLTEICEQNKTLKNLIDINFYSPDIYFKIFLEKNNFGFSQKNIFYQGKVTTKDNKSLKLFIFDSLSPEPIKYYSSSKYWNKRKVETRLAMALMIKRFKENLSIEEIINNSQSVENFLNIFENNYEIVEKSLDIYLKKEAYNLKELKEELPIDKILKDINNYQGALMTKEFKLYDRIKFILKEHQIIGILYYKMKIGEEIDWKEKIEESAKLLRENYYCYSEEMMNLEAELKIQFGINLPIKSISNGWAGKMVIIGNDNELKKYEEFIEKKYEKYLENQGDGLAYAWITDDIKKYCFISELEKGICILDPKYEDFMLEYIKHKNNIEPSEVIKAKIEQ
jgi:galactokinase